MTDDRHARVCRGRDAIAAVLETLGMPADEARSRAGNAAMVLGNAEPGDDTINGVAAAICLRGALMAVLAAWACAERAA